nr:MULTISPECIES: beta-N-acetylhexosaminidase [unclassified Paenibacillus]
MAGRYGEAADPAVILRGMSLEEKVGQLLLCGFDGTEPSADIERLIREQAIGGVILFARNVTGTKQAAALNRSLQAAAADGGRLPLWIAVDQEGGMVARFTDGLALMPGAMAIAAGGDAYSAYEAGYVCGCELGALGVNMNFAPVLDVNNNPSNPVIGVRSFGEDPERVAEFGVRLVQGLQDAGMVATAKHFPGHGDTDTDSHLDLPVVRHARERIEQVELVPFRKVIEAGIDSVMSAHIVFPAYEQEKLPATLSHAVLTGLLREELGFEGVIMTDCMEMNAIADHFGTAEAAVMAVEAGADLVLISHRHDRQLRAWELLLQAVREGRITEERIDESVLRLLRLKARRGVLMAVETGEESRVAGEVGSEKHLAAAKRISEASVTIVKNESGLLPLAPGQSMYVLSMEPAVRTLAEEQAPEGIFSLGRALRELGANETEWLIPFGRAAELKEELVRACMYAERVIVATYNAYLEADQVELVEALQRFGKDPIVVALRSPYDLLAFPEVATFVAVYESRPLAMRSAAAALLGLNPAEGKLPVSLGERYPAGTGRGLR